MDAARFQRNRKLGEGGMGVVWEAFDAKLRTRVALKTLRALTPDAVLRLKHEFRALQDLHHENLIALGELIEDDGEWFFTMELVEGVDFLAYVRRESPSGGERDTMQARIRTASWDGEGEVEVPEAPPPGKPFFDEARLRETLVQVARGLQALHASGMVHRDVKPSNILVTENGRVRILDFGLIAHAGGAEREGHLVGTLWYMAPEQASGQPVGPAADWYALGVLLYEALAGRVPFAGPNARAVLEAKERAQAEPPRQLAIGVPSDLEELCLQLLQRDPEARVAAVAKWLGEAPQPSKLPFVGRTRELSQLSQVGTGRTVVISGESGVGKSSLLRRFLEELPDGTVVLGGRCHERESVPYKAIDGVIDAASRLLAKLPPAEAQKLEPEHAGALAQLFPVLEWKRPFFEIEPRLLRAQAVGALRELLSNLSARHPLVITIEDFQWTDADSLELLREVMRRPPALRLVLTVRSEGQVVELAGPVERVHLEKLPREEAALLAERLLQQLAPGRTLDTDALAAEAEGHPLFIAELVRSADHQGPAPVKLDEALFARVGRLEPLARDLLEALSVAGHPLSVEAAAQLTGLDPVALGRLAGRLRSAQLLGSDSALELYHDRIRAAVQAHLSPPRTRELHKRLALALEATQHVEPELLAIHWFGADDTKSAARYAAQAADQAAQALAFDRAARLYRLALEWDGTRPRRLQVALGEALANAGRSAEAAQAFHAAAEGAPRDEALDLERRSAQQYLSGGRIDEGMVAIHAVLEAVGLQLPKTPQRALLSLLAARARLRLRGLEFVPRAESALEPMERMRIDATYAIALTLGTVDTISGTDFQTRNLIYALDAGEPHRIARALLLEASFRSLPGPTARERAEALLLRAEKLAAELGNPHLNAWTSLSRGYIQFLWGRFGQALPHFLAAEKLFRERCRDVAYELDSIKLFALWSRFYLGQVGEVMDQLPPAIADAHSRGDVSAVANLGSRVSHLCALADDDPERARRETTEALDAWSQRGFYAQHYYALYAQTQIELYQGAPALERLNASWKALEKSLLLRVQFIHVEALHLRARAALQAGQLARARKDARSILHMRLDWGTPLADLILAAADRDVGRLDRAIAGLDSVGLALYAACARRQRARLRGETPEAMERIRNPDRLADMLVPGFGR